MSVALHASALLVCAIFFEATPRLLSVSSKERRAEIVLVPAPAATETATWMDDADEEQVESSGGQLAQTANEQLHGAPTREQTSAGDALPTAGSPPALVGMLLPERTGGGSTEGVLVSAPGKLGGRGRPAVLPGIHEAEILAQEAARPKELPPRGTPARLSVFGVPATGRSFVFVIDRSESMGGSHLGAIDAAADELSASIKELSEQQFFQVVSYNQAATIFARRELMPAREENKQELIAFVRKLSAFGGTEHTYGLQAALKLRPEVIYLLTDGGDPVPNSLQLRTIREAAAGRTQIHCVHFGNGSSPATGTEFLQKIASDNGGRYTYIDMSGR